MQRRSVSIPREAKAAFTLIELLVVIAIISILGAILLPVMAQARQKAQGVVCLSSMRQLTMAMNLYVQDNDSHFAPEGARPHTIILQPYIKTDGIFVCPTTVMPLPDTIVAYKKIGTPTSSYAMNWHLRGVSYQQTQRRQDAAASDSSVEFPTTTVCFTESNYVRYKHVTNNLIKAETWLQGVVEPISFDCPMDEYELIGAPAALRHNLGSNYSFVDGHVKWLRPGQVQKYDEPNTGKSASFVL